jgi:hypothetical protein
MPISFPRLFRTLLTGLLVVAFWPNPVGAKPDGRRRGKIGITKKKPAKAQKRKKKTTRVLKRRGRDTLSLDKQRTRRRSIERSRHVRLPPAETVKTIVVRKPGCHFRGVYQLRRQLLALRNPGQILNLEVWGDSHLYRPRQKVFFLFRSPKPAYVTLFWLGPMGAVVVPIINVPLPANQNTRVDSGGIIVPPYGREQWVAISTLEPITLPCYAGESAMMSAIRQTKRIPHAVGKWEVVSTGKIEAGGPALPRRFRFPGADRRLLRP